MECYCHLEALWRDITNSSLDVVWDPLHEVRRVLVLHVEHLFINLLRNNPTAEQRGGSEIAAMTWISSAHHILGIKHLLGQFWHCEGPVLLRATGGERRKANHEEVQARERNEIHCKLAQISIELTREAKACCHA